MLGLRRRRLVSNLFSHRLTFPFTQRYNGNHLHFEQGGLVEHLEDKYGINDRSKKKFIR